MSPLSLLLSGVRGSSIAGDRVARKERDPLSQGLYGHLMTIGCTWRGGFTNEEANRLHSRAFSTRLHTGDEWDWVSLTSRHSLGWVVAREGAALVGFVNVLWDGLVHAWLQDVMVDPVHARGGVGTQLVRHAGDGARQAGCEYLHVDFEPHLTPFYIDACGFRSTTAGLMRLRP